MDIFYRMFVGDNTVSQALAAEQRASVARHYSEKEAKMHDRCTKVDDNR